MLTVALVALLVLAAGTAGLLFVLKKRIERGTAAKAAAKALSNARLAEGRQRGELNYVLARIDGELQRLSTEAIADAGLVARLHEIRDVLRQTYVTRRDSFPVSGPCAEVIEAFRGPAAGRDLLYSESGDGRWLHVHADRALIRWAVGEIFANAVDHAGDWSRIAILAEPADGAIVLTVRDDGGGAEPSVASRLYSAFTPRFRSPGPGLGLYAVRMIVESQGGSVEGGGARGQGFVHRVRLPYPSSGPYGDRTATTHHAAEKQSPRGH